MVKGVSKQAKRDFICKVKSHLTKNPKKILQVEKYNDCKRLVRNLGRSGGDQSIGRLVDNGQHFAHIMSEAVKGCGDVRIHQKWEQLRASNREEKEAKKNPKHCLQAPRDLPTTSTSSFFSGSISDETTRFQSRCPREVPAGVLQKKECTTDAVDTTIGVYYCRTDDCPGDKEYSCVVLKTAREANGSNVPPTIHYRGDIYDYRIHELRGDPTPSSCNYRVLFEVPVNQLRGLQKRAGSTESLSVGWVEGPLKDQVLQYWTTNRAD